MSEALAWLEPILTRRRKDGSFYYSNEDVARFIPVFLLTMGVDPRTLPPNIAQVVANFAGEAGVKPGMSRDDARETIQAHLQKHPLHPELLFEVRRGMREERSTESIEARGRQVAVAIGAIAGRTRGMFAPPPEGAVRAGPMARFDLGNVLGPKPRKK